MKSRGMKKHFVRFFSPGTLFAEVSEREIDSWDVEVARKLAGKIMERHEATPYGFQFFTRKRRAGDLDSHESNHSSMYFLPHCRVDTLAEILERNNPDEEILRDNMRINGYDKVAITTKGWKITVPFRDGDVLLDE